MDNSEIDILKSHNAKLRHALKRAVMLIMKWHGPEVFDIYFHKSPEMKSIRELCQLHEIMAVKKANTLDPSPFGDPICKICGRNHSPYACLEE